MKRIKSANANHEVLGGKLPPAYNLVAAAQSNSKVISFVAIGENKGYWNALYDLWLSLILYLIVTVLQYDVPSIVLLPINNHINLIACGCVKATYVGSRWVFFSVVYSRKTMCLCMFKMTCATLLEVFSR